MSSKELAWKFGSIAGRIHDQTVKPVTYKQDPSEVIEQYLKENGLVIVPAGDVPTPEDRAAVGRLAAWVTARQAFVRAANAKPIDEKLVCSWATELRYADKALQPGDIEAAQRVVGGK